MVADTAMPPPRRGTVDGETLSRMHAEWDAAHGRKVKHSRLESFENAVEDMRPTLQAVFVVAVFVVFWLSVFWCGSTLGAFLRGVLP